MGILSFSPLHNLIIISSSIICAATLPSKTNLTTLQLVQIIARHGDRAPILPYPNDLYKKASVYSINGWGELTEIGAKQVYELGTFLRQRYDGWLPRKYRKRDFLMMSSDIDRAIMSGEANLAGLYELGQIPRSRDIFKDWQPVPIHTIPESEDNFINGKAHCPRYASLYREYFSSEEFTSFLKENEDFIEFIANKSGLASIVQDFSEIFQVQDALRCQRLHNLQLPTWANSTVTEQLDYFKALSFVWAVKTLEMKKLKVGPLFGKLVEGMSEKVKKTLISNEEEEIPPYQDLAQYRKMYVYSGHDSTISGVLQSLNIFNPLRIPPYASALIIELHRDPGSGEFFVELFYKNDTSSVEPHRFDPGLFCEASSPCSFEKFSNIANNLIPDSWENECQLQPSSQTSFPRGGNKQLFSLMRITPINNVPTSHSLRNQTQSDESFTHPLGMTAPGLPGFLLTVLSVTSLLASLALLSYLITKRIGGSSLYSAVYQHLRQ